MKYINFLRLIIARIKNRCKKATIVNTLNPTFDELNEKGIRELRKIANGKVRGFMRMSKFRLINELLLSYNK